MDGAPQRDTGTMVGDILAFSRKTLVLQNYLIPGFSPPLLITTNKSPLHSSQ